MISLSHASAIQPAWDRLIKYLIIQVGLGLLTVEGETEKQQTNSLPGCTDDASNCNTSDETSHVQHTQRVGAAPLPASKHYQQALNVYESWNEGCSQDF